MDNVISFCNAAFIFQVWYAEQQIIMSREKRDYIVPPDPGWTKQWSLVRHRPAWPVIV